MRFLFWLFVIIIVWSWWRQLFPKRPRSFAGGNPHNYNTARKDLSQAAQMIACAKCGTYILQSEALQQRGQCYCSKTCLP